MTDSITEADLLAYVDEQLDAERRIEVEEPGAQVALPHQGRPPGGTVNLTLLLVLCRVSARSGLRIINDLDVLGES